MNPHRYFLRCAPVSPHPHRLFLHQVFHPAIKGVWQQLRTASQNRDWGSTRFRGCDQTRCRVFEPAVSFRSSVQNEISGLCLEGLRFICPTTRVSRSTAAHPPEPSPQHGQKPPVGDTHPKRPKNRLQLKATAPHTAHSSNSTELP